MFITWNDSEHDLGYINSASLLLHPAGVKSSILLPHSEDLQAVVVSFKLGLGASYGLHPFLWPARAPQLHPALLLSPDGAVVRGVTTVQCHLRTDTHEVKGEWDAKGQSCVLPFVVFDPHDAGRNIGCRAGVTGQYSRRTHFSKHLCLLTLNSWGRNTQNIFQKVYKTNLL